MPVQRLILPEREAGGMCILADMSHELRTPLNAIIGFADLLRAGAVPVASAKHGEFLGHIGSSGRHLLQLINGVLERSKVESGKFEFAPEPLDLPRLLQELPGVPHTGLPRKHLRLGIDIDPALDGLVLDPARLKQALYHYLSNGIKFTPGHGRIAVRPCAEGGAQLRIEVEDSGNGIAAADLGRLFGAPGHPVSRPRVLIVDDHALNIELARYVLDADGFEVDAAADAGQALACIAERRPDLVLMDIQLPGQDGLSLTRQLKADPATRGIVVVAFTALAMKGDEARMREAGCGGYLAKPIEVGR